MMKILTLDIKLSLNPPILIQVSASPVYPFDKLRTMNSADFSTFPNLYT